MPVPAMISMAWLEKLTSAGSPPLATANRKNIGSPIGTPIASACATEPVSTPRRVTALFKPKETADKTAKAAPSTFPGPPAGQRAQARGGTLEKSLVQVKCAVGAAAIHDPLTMVAAR
jgi:hypothetical protein